VKTHQVTLIFPDGTQTPLEVSEDERIWHAANRAGVELPSMCRQGWCITCAALVEGEGEWDQSASLRYFPEDREGNFILLCTAKPRSDLRIRTHQQAAMRACRERRSISTP
jgi:ferredoxin